MTSQRPLAAYQGEPGAFSEVAALKYFGPRTDLRSFGSFKEVFQFVARRRNAFGVIPIENSVYGSIHQNYDHLMKFHLSIIGELKLRVELHVVGLPGATMRNLRVLFSQPQALGQCEDFLQSLDRVDVVAHHDTAGAAMHVRDSGNKTWGAIASAEAARRYGLRILKRNVESHHRNFTRFLILSRSPLRSVHRPKTSIVFAVKDIPGALFKSLAVFAMRDINLLKIESRPLIGRPWEYLFYLDVEGKPADVALRQALNHLQEVSILVRVLGTYEKAK